jgi:hypothetical protein
MLSSDFAQLGNPIYYRHAPLTELILNPKLPIKNITSVEFVNGHR